MKTHKHCGADLIRSALLVAAIAATSISTGLAQSGNASSKTRPHVVALASDRLEGRLTGSAGERLAADYLVSELQRIGYGLRVVRRVTRKARWTGPATE